MIDPAKRDHPPSPSTHWLGLAFLTLAVLTSVIDSSVMTVVTPTISRRFNAPLPVVEWTTTIYSLFFGATMLLWGKLGSLFGHRRLFVIGSVLFAVGSALVGWAPTIGLMIAMRALQGIGAAMFNPAAIALIGYLFGPNDRPLAYGINGMAGSVGVALGYVLGATFAEYFDWRWSFYINLPICAVAVAGAMRFIPGRPTLPVSGPLDIYGAAQSLLGLALIIVGLSEAQTLGWWESKVPLKLFGHPIPFSLALVSLLAGLMVMAFYVRRELRLTRRGREPVFDVTLFRRPSFRWGGLISMLRYLAQFTVNYCVTLYLQLDEGVTAMHAAFVSLPNAAAGLLAGPLGGWLANRIGVARAVQIGLVCQAAGISWVWFLFTPHLSARQLIGPFGLFGFGSGLSGAQLNTASLQDVPPERIGDASSAITTFRQLGASFAVAVFGILAATSTARLALEGYDRTEVGALSMQEVVLAMLIVNLGCLALSVAIPNKGVMVKSAAAGGE